MAMVLMVELMVLMVATVAMVVTAEAADVRHRTVRLFCVPQQR
jgi:hypothetical protein